MAEELEVIIGANTKGIEEGATRAERALSDVQKSIKRLERDISKNITISRGYKSAIDDLTRAYKSGDVTQDQYSQGIRRLQRDEKETQVETRRLTAEMRNLQREQKQLSSTVNTGAGSMNKMGKATRVNAVPAMTSFSQVIQDAPYGIQGVANNIQQLTMQMGYMTRSAGSTGAAMKAMFASLAGPAGILLGVSLVTTAFISYGDEILALITKTDNLSKKTAEFIGEAENEITVLNALLGVARDENEEKDVRLRALNKINDKYGDYLGNLDLEKLKTSQVADQIDRLTQSLIAEAKVRGAQSLIEEKAKNLAEDAASARETASRFALSAISDENSAIREQRRGYEQLIDTLEKQKAEPGADVTGINTAIEETQKKIGELTETLSDVGSREEAYIANYVKEQTKEAEEEIEELGSVLQKAFVNAFKLGGENGIDPLEIDPVRVPIEPVMGNLSGDGGDPRLQASLQWQAALTRELELLKEQQSFLPQFSEGWKMYGEAIAGVEDRLSGFANSLAESGRAASEEFAALNENLGLENLNAKFQETQEYANIFASSAGTAISELGNVFQQQFAETGKAMQVFSGLVINTITQVISQLLQQAIQEKLIGQTIKRAEQGKASAKGITIATNAAAAAGPPGIALLPGFLASTQAMIQGSFAAIEAFNFGGFVGDKNLVRMNGNERVLTATEANTFNNLMQSRNVNTGEQKMQIDLNVTGGLSGENISFAVDRYKVRNNRVG